MSTPATPPIPLAPRTAPIAPLAAAAALACAAAPAPSPAPAASPAPVPPAAAAPALPSLPPLQSLPVLAQPVTLPFELVGDHILVDALVNGVPARLFVDTGSSLTSLDADWAAAHGVSAAQQSGTVLGTAAVSARMGRADSIRVGGVAMGTTPVILIPLGAVAEAMGRAVHGTLGFDLISRYVVDIDYAARRLTFRDAASYRYEGAGVVVPVSLQLRVPVVQATVTPPDGAPIAARLLLDLGSGELPLRLFTPFVEAHADALAPLPGVEAPLGVGVGGMIVGRMVRLAEARAGGLVIAEPVAGLARERTGAMALTIVDGTIGAPVFRRTRMILDYPRQRVIFEPGPHMGDPYPFDACGLAFDAPAEGAYVVRFVVPGSPAAAAGLVAGDEILAVDGRPATRAGVGAVHDSFRAVGATHRLTVRRAGSVREVEARLRRMV